MSSKSSRSNVGSNGSNNSSGNSGNICIRSFLLLLCLISISSLPVALARAELQRRYNTARQQPSETRFVEETRSCATTTSCKNTAASDDDTVEILAHGLVQDIGYMLQGVAALIWDMLHEEANGVDMTVEVIEVVEDTTRNGMRQGGERYAEVGFGANFGANGMTSLGNSFKEGMTELRLGMMSISVAVMFLGLCCVGIAAFGIEHTARRQKNMSLLFLFLFLFGIVLMLI